MMEASTILHRHGVPCGPVHDLPDVLNSPQAAARNMVLTVDDPIAGQQRIIGNPIKMSGNDDRASLPVSCAGADTTTVLTDLLGIDATEFAALRAQGAFG